jgi:hypothetical protein
MPDQWSGIATLVSKSLTPKAPGLAEPPNRYGHDRAMRIACVAERLAAAIDKHQRPRRVDLVRIAALYTSVGLVSAARRRSPDEPPDDPVELAADQLPAFLSATDVVLTLRILSEYRIKKTTLPEAQLLADAVGLEDVGLVGLWNQTRVFHAAGKTLEQIVKLWTTQRQYGYWNSRLADGFHFAASRAVAERRLAEMGPIFEQMLKECKGEDIGGAKEK